MGGDFNTQTPAQQVVERVSDAEGVSTLELTPLAEQVDTDALNMLFSSPAKTEIELRFKYEGYTVTISGRDDISLEEDKSPTQ
jgi:hypothetical protein